MAVPRARTTAIAGETAERALIPRGRKLARSTTDLGFGWTAILLTLPGTLAAMKTRVE